MATLRPQLAHTPARAWKHGNPSPRAAHRTQSTYLRPRRGCQVDRGAAMARVGARTKGGGSGWRLFFEITRWVPRYHTSGTHRDAQAHTQAVQLECTLCVSIVSETQAQLNATHHGLVSSTALAVLSAGGLGHAGNCQCDQWPPGVLCVLDSPSLPILNVVTY